MSDTNAENIVECSRCGNSGSIEMESYALQCKDCGKWVVSEDNR